MTLKNRNGLRKGVLRGKREGDGFLRTYLVPWLWEQSEERPQQVLCYRVGPKNGEQAKWRFEVYLHAFLTSWLLNRLG